MDKSTIEKLAQAHAKIMANYTECSKPEAAQIAARTLQIIVQDTLGASVAVPEGIERIEKVAEPQRSEANYSPGEGSVLSPKGYRCYCAGCKGDVYELVADIRSRGMGIDAFIKAFKPLGSAPVFTRDMLVVIKDNYGNTFIDCPVCKGDKSLMIVGQPSREAQEHAVAPDVESVDPKELGLS